MGLPQRYRLFFRAFAEQEVIVILWLGFPRKEGDRQDCYQVFGRMIANGKLPESFEALLAESNSSELPAIEVESVDPESVSDK